MLRSCLFMLCLGVLFSSLSYAMPRPYIQETHPFGLPDALSNEGWTLRIDQQGIRIYTRKMPESHFVAVKTEQVIHSTLSNIVANYLDVSSFPEWVKDLQSARVLEGFNAKQERKVYLLMDMPWPLRNRDSVMGQRVSQDPNSLVVRIREWNEGQSIPDVDGVIRVPKVDSEMVLFPQKEGGVKMIWQGHNEPGGHIPSFIANWLIDSVFYESSLNMRVRFESPDFKKPAPGIVDMYPPVDLEK